MRAQPRLPRLRRRELLDREIRHLFGHGEDATRRAWQVPAWYVVFRLSRTPDPEHLSHFLARQRTAPLTYAEVGATFDDELPAGYHHVRAAPSSARATTTWDAGARGDPSVGGAPRRGHDRRARPTRPSPRARRSRCSRRSGRSTSSRRAASCASSTNPTATASPTARCPSHPEEGEEHFVVTRADDGTVGFEVVAFSRPHDLLTKLGGPIPRRIQARATEQYLQGMRDFVTR